MPVRAPAPTTPLTRRTKRFDAPAWLCAGLGALCFLLVYGPAVLNPTADAWIFKGYIGVDVLQHYAGWVAFRAGEWAWPLTFTNMLCWPFGGAASLTDCIPLAAVFFKLLAPLLPATFQYFGLFVLGCMAAMGFFAAKLLGLFGLSAPQRLCGSALFIASPVLLERAFQHTALAAQFLVVAALWLYFRARRQGFARPVWGFAVLAGLAAGTHVYFVPMVLALAFAACVEALIKTKNLRPLLWFAGAVAAALFVALLLGFFSRAEYVPGGYGNFGLNLNAFYNPASYNWASWDASYQNLSWSRFLPMRPVVGDSLGSFAYLGLGALVGLLVGAAGFVWRGLRQIRQGNGSSVLPARQKNRSLVFFLKSHAGLLFSLACLSAFSITTRVTLSSRILLDIPLPAAVIRVADMFRASGRLIWPVYYLLLLCACLGLAALGTAAPRQTHECINSPTTVGSDDPALRFRGRKLPVCGVPRSSRPTKYQALAQYHIHAVAVTAALCAVLVLQLVDIGPTLLQKHADFNPLPLPEAAAAPANWAQAAKAGRVWYLLEPTEDRPTALRCALAGMPSNYYLLARGDAAALAAHMEETRAALLAGQPPFPNTAYATKDAALAQQLQTALGGQCQLVETAGYFVFVV